MKTETITTVGLIIMLGILLVGVILPMCIFMFKSLKSTWKGTCMGTWKSYYNRIG